MFPRFLPNPFGSQRSLPSPSEAAGLTREEALTVTTVVQGEVLDQTNNVHMHSACIVVDTSVSMNGPRLKAGSPIEQLNAGLKRAAKEIRSDPLLAETLALGLIGFSNNPNVHFEVLHPFSHPSEFYPKTVVADSRGTPLCRCIIEWVETLLTVRKAVSCVAGREQKKAWVMVFSDGLPTDLDYESQARDSIKIAGQNGICFYFFGVGETCDLHIMKRLSQSGRPPQMMPYDGWAKYFKWLHCSVSRASMSQGGDVWEDDSPFGDGKLLMEI